MGERELGIGIKEKGEGIKFLLRRIDIGIQIFYENIEGMGWE